MAKAVALGDVERHLEDELGQLRVVPPDARGVVRPPAVQGRVADPSARLRRHDEVAVELGGLRVALDGDVRAEDVPTRRLRQELHPVERPPPEHHRPAAGARVVVELQRGRPAALAVDAPRVAEAVRAAVGEVALRPLVVASDALVDVVGHGGRRGHRTQRRVRLVDEDVPVVGESRPHGGVLVVRVVGVLEVADEPPHADVRPVVDVDSLAGEPRRHGLHVGDRPPEVDRALELASGQPDALGEERLAARVEDGDPVHLHDLRPHVGLVVAELEAHGRVAGARVGGVRIGERRPDARLPRERHLHVADVLVAAGHERGPVAVRELEDRRAAVPAVGVLEVDAVRRDLVDALQREERAGRLVGGRARRHERSPRLRGDVLEPERDVPAHREERRDVLPRRAVEADRLLHVPDRALDPLLFVLREEERIGLRGARPRGGEHPDVLDVHDVRPHAVDAVGVRAVAAQRVVDRAVRDADHARAPDADVAAEAGRRHRRRVGREVHVDAARAELAVVEREARGALGVRVEAEEVRARVHAVPAEVDAVEDELLDVRKLERGVRRRRLDVRVGGLVLAPGAPRLLGDELPHRVGRNRHPEHHEVRHGGVRPDRQRAGLRLSRAPDDVAGVVRNRPRRSGQGVQRGGGRRARPVRRPGGVDVEDGVVDVRVAHCHSLRPMNVEWFSIAASSWIAGADATVRPGAAEGSPPPLDQDDRRVRPLITA